MFLRFVTHTVDEKSGHRQGLFRADLPDNDILPEDRQELDRLMDWFRENLARPSRLSHSRKRYAEKQAISWLKADAIEHVRRMRQLAEILIRYGIPVEVLTTERPGYIVYEDEHQVAAYPFNDTPT